jgi:hypothetical protein
VGAVIVRYTDRGLEGLAVARRHMKVMEANFEVIDDLGCAGRCGDRG